MPIDASQLFLQYTMYGHSLILGLAMLLVDVTTLSLFGIHKIAVVSLVISLSFISGIQLLLFENDIINMIGSLLYYTIVLGAFFFSYFWLESRLGRLTKCLGFVANFNAYAMRFFIDNLDLTELQRNFYLLCSLCAAMVFNVLCIVSVLKLVKENPGYKTNEKQYRIFKICVFASVYPAVLYVGYLVITPTTNQQISDMILPYWKLGYACIHFMLQYNKVLPQRQKEIDGLSDIE